MNDEQLVNLGNQAETLLNTEAFTTTISGLVDSTIQAFLGSSPDERAVRNKAYDHYRALSDIVATLKQQVEVRDNIDSKTEETTEEE